MVLTVMVVGAGGYVVWHRSKDPARAWAHTVEQDHVSKISERLRRCFGADDPEGIRRLLPEIRRGNFPASVRGCSGRVYSDLIASPGDFARSLRNPPSWASSAQVRERNKLERLGGSLIQFERATGSIDRNAPIPDGARDRVLTALEDVAVDVDAEQSSFSDLMNTTENGASWW
jgi:hypothetical protein